jgi:serine/threonine-protein kinase RIO1
MTLAWAFINIMNAVHHCEILHNDLSKDNIMLHFSSDKPNVVYIGVCD